MNDPTQHNYMKRILEMQARGELPASGLSDVQVAHDDWCSVHTGGYCNCDPEITALRRPTRPPYRPSEN
jgi:hypothetical protein